MRSLAHWLTTAALVAACTPGLGPIRLPTVTGAVVDRASGAPIAGAEVFQTWHGGGTPGGTRPVHHARWTTTDSSGRFRFPADTLAAPATWGARTYAPRYDFYHPDFGLVRGPRAHENRVELAGDAAQARQRHMDLQVFCQSTADDPGSHRLREVACPPRHAR